MHIVILIIGVILVVYGPQLWARAVLNRYNSHQEHYPGTGGDYARHLLNLCGLVYVKVEASSIGDHYDPQSKCVRLSSTNLNGKSLTAVTVAAHEVGHAIQDFTESPLLKTRTRLVRVAQTAEKAGSMAMFAIPVVVGLTRAPSAGLLMFLIGLCTLGVSTLVHLVTLPVEWDASFGKAMPLMKEEQFFSKQEELASRKILKACALTYLAASLASLLNIWRWLRFIRR